MRRSKFPVIYIVLVLMAGVLVTSHLASGLSAKFTSGFGGSSTTHVAKFAGGTIGETSTTPNVDVTTLSTKAGKHIFFADFDVHFDACEVSREFTLTLSRSEDFDNTSFAVPSGQIYI